jgi:TolB-like protein/predicted Zn-dependent protease
MGLRESDGSIRPMNAMIARLRKATTAWTARFHQSYSESIREQPVELADAQPVLDAPQISDFELLRCIGRGSYGEVWLARNILGTYRAVKIVERKAFRDEEAFEREFSGLRRFEPISREHDGFVAILHVGRNRPSGYFYYVMELADNDPNAIWIEPDAYVPKTLSNELTRCGRLSIEQTVQLGLSLSQALEELHRRGLVHRDVKPSNIIFVKGHAKLADIGLVAQTGEKNRLGTEGYIPPEGPGKPQADLYSLGMVLYEASTGTDRLDYPDLPADFDAMAERETFLTLNSIILKACDNDVRKRYQTATEIIQDLSRLGVGLPVEKSRRNLLRKPVTAFSALLFGALAVALAFYWLRHPTTSLPPEKSIAVLPFENLSGDPANSYFADGIQDEILTRLAKIADLKVISRTSTQRYESKPANLSEIGRQLGAANILEGSVQKVAGQVRVNVQLVNAQTDSHTWAETYDRKLSDIFSVESEIAKGIAESLQAKLTGHEEQALAAKPTNNLEAYDAYLRGLAFQARTGQSIHLALKTIDYFERAVQLDPNFAIAWARLSRAHAYLYFQRVDTARPDLAKDALDHAQKLQPNSPDTLLALGYYQYWVVRDYGLAKASFHQVSKLSPGSSEVAWALSAVNRRLGNWNESLAAVEAGLALDPRNGELLTTSAWTYAMLRQFPAALERYDRAVEIIANDPDLMSLEAGIYQAQGNLEQAAKFLSGVTDQTPFDNAFFVKVTLLRLERNHMEAIRLLQARLAQLQFTSEIYKGATQVYLAIAQRLAGDSTGTKLTAEQARKTLEPLCQKQPDNSNFAEWLALAYAALGEKNLAQKEAERAITLLPSTKDAVDGPGAEENLALVQALFGENRKAVSNLRRLLQTPFQSQLYGPMPLTTAFLRLDPLWDSLRDDPVFQELCAEIAPIPTPPGKSIAVLPFENLSRDPEHAYLAKGIQEEIVTRLAKIADLKVVSRASTQRYPSKPDNLPEIAKQLGVANVLEGSVQKAGDQVRINVQLLNAQNNSHLWAETYDRQLSNVLDVESEVAVGIAQTLQAKLTGREEQALAVKPTKNPDAYDAYLRGLVFQARGIFSDDILRKAISFYERAVQLDPNFALAWARLSRADSLVYMHSDDKSAARRDASKKALEYAQKLQPDSPETLLALGYYQYYVLGDYDLAKTTFRFVGNMLPRSSEVAFALSSVTRREGKWNETLAWVEQALALDPRNSEVITMAAWTYGLLRQFPTALKLYDRALDIGVNDPDLMSLKAGVYQAQGNLEEAAKLLSEINAQTPTDESFLAKVTQLRLERNHSEAVRLLQARLAQSRFASEIHKGIIQVFLAFAQHLAGHTAAARVSAEQARNTLEPLCNNQPDNWNFAAWLALAYAELGEKDPAVKEAERATVLLPSAKDAVDGPSAEENLALVQTIFGENSHAISTLSRLLQMPFESELYGSAPLTPAFLRLDPLWDSLRADPDFQELCK